VTSEFIHNIVWPSYILMRIKSKANFKAANTRSVAQREITNMPLLSLMKYENCICVAAQNVSHTRGYAYMHQIRIPRQAIFVNREWSIARHSFESRLFQGAFFREIAPRKPFTVNNIPFTAPQRIVGALLGESSSAHVKVASVS